MNINAEVISKFAPCTNRFNNFKEQNPVFNGSLKEFLSLDNISYTDKIWVATRLMTRNQKFRFAVACAESVFYLFEKHQPNDNRVKDLISFMKTILDVETMSENTRTKLITLRNAADTAAAAAAAAAYAAAADTAAAVYAAADAVYAADTAADAADTAADTAAAADAAAAYAAAAADAADTAAAYAAANAAADTAAAAAYAAAREIQQDINLLLSVEIMEEDV